MLGCSLYTARDGMEEPGASATMSVTSHWPQAALYIKINVKMQSN